MPDLMDVMHRTYSVSYTHTHTHNHPPTHTHLTRTNLPKLYFLLDLESLFRIHFCYFMIYFLGLSLSLCCCWAAAAGRSAEFSQLLVQVAFSHIISIITKSIHFLCLYRSQSENRLVHHDFFRFFSSCDTLLFSLSLTVFASRFFFWSSFAGHCHCPSMQTPCAQYEMCAGRLSFLSLTNA